MQHYALPSLDLISCKNKEIYASTKYWSHIKMIL